MTHEVRHRLVLSDRRGGISRHRLGAFVWHYAAWHMPGPSIWWKIVGVLAGPYTVEIRWGRYDVPDIEDAEQSR